MHIQQTVASVGFNDKEFSVSEAEGDISDTLYIVRVGDAEQIQRVEVQVVQLFDEATLGTCRHNKWKVYNTLAGIILYSKCTYLLIWHLPYRK